MKKQKVGTKKLEKLLIVNGHEFSLDSSFQTSESTTTNEGETALHLRYKDRPEQEASSFASAEAGEVQDFLEKLNLTRYINSYGTDIKQEPHKKTQMYTPYVAIVGDLEPILYD